MTIQYRTDATLGTDEFIDLLKRSTLSKRRPIDDATCIRGMLDNASLMVSAWAGTKLVGLARSLTDFHYACYLSDLAVDTQYQRQGIGKQLLLHTQAQLGPRCRLLLLAAPDAHSYYEHLGFESHPRCWSLSPEKPR